MSAMTKSETIQPSETIAISLGCDYASVALIPTEPGAKGEIIANEDGERRIPVVVGVENGEEFAGTAAKAQGIRNLRATVKRFLPIIGLPFDSPVVSETKKSSSVRMVPHPEDETKPAYEIETTSLHQHEQENGNGEDEDMEGETVTRYYTPEDLLTIFLSTLKTSAENYTGTSIPNAVLCVPSYLSDIQKKAVVDATVKAGLTVVGLIDESSASLLAYDFVDTVNHVKSGTTAHPSHSRTSLLLDIGASYTSVTLATVTSHLYTLHSHLTHPVGGTVIDTAMLTHFMQEFKRKHKIDISDNRKSKEKLLAACEITKKVLSTGTTAQCSVESLFEGMDFVGTVNRQRVEMMCLKFKKEVVGVIEKCLEKGGYRKEEIDQVILVGGTTKFPLVQKLMTQLFPDASIRSSIDQEETTTLGASIYAYQLSINTPAFEISQSKVNSLGSSTSQANEQLKNKSKHLTKPIGIVDSNGSFIEILKRGSPVPQRYTFHLTGQPESESDKPAGYVTPVSITLAEGNPKIVTTIPPKPERVPSSDDESDVSEDEPEPIESLTYEPVVLGEVVIGGEEEVKGKEIKDLTVVLKVSEDGKVHVEAHAHVEGKKVHVSNEF
ncbi:Hsp70 protein-domain-containing protein [Paraphysoderma sedebokerense]|nr:Hsp70 protein-domain-containing protein [Paraphysoderma sedebokerense]